MKPPSKAAMARAERKAETAPLNAEALAYWFEISGTTMADLEAAIDRWPSVTDGGVPVLGVHPEVTEPVMQYGVQRKLSRDAVIMIARAMQRIAMRRSFLAIRAQADLFGSPDNEGAP